MWGCRFTSLGFVELCVMPHEQQAGLREGSRDVGDSSGTEDSGLEDMDDSDEGTTSEATE
jgi:hypothetical protein